MMPSAIVGCKRLLANSQVEARTHANGSSVFDVKDAARPLVARLRRCVDQEGPHRNDSARRSNTVDGLYEIRSTPNLFVGEHAADMRTWQHPKRAIRLSRVV